MLSLHEWFITLYQSLIQALWLSLSMIMTRSNYDATEHLFMYVLNELYAFIMIILLLGAFANIIPN